MNWLDAAILALVAWFTFAAFQAGFIRESVTVVAAVLGVILAGMFYIDLADDVLLFIDSEYVARIVAFGVLFAATAAEAGSAPARALRLGVRHGAGSQRQSAQTVAATVQIQPRRCRPEQCPDGAQRHRTSQRPGPDGKARDH